MVLTLICRVVKGRNRECTSQVCLVIYISVFLYYFYNIHAPVLYN